MVCFKGYVKSVVQSRELFVALHLWSDFFLNQFSLINNSSFCLPGEELKALSLLNCGFLASLHTQRYKHPSKQPEEGKSLQSKGRDCWLCVLLSVLAAQQVNSFSGLSTPGHL